MPQQSLRQKPGVERFCLLHFVLRRATRAPTPPHPSPPNTTTLGWDHTCLFTCCCTNSKHISCKERERDTHITHILNATSNLNSTWEHKHRTSSSHESSSRLLCAASCEGCGRVYTAINNIACIRQAQVNRDVEHVGLEGQGANGIEAGTQRLALGARHRVKGCGIALNNLKKTHSRAEQESQQTVVSRSQCRCLTGRLPALGK